MLKVAPEIEAELGAGVMRRLREVAVGAYNCVVCEAAGHAGDDDTSVVVFSGSQKHDVKLAHATCAQSQVVVVPDDDDTAGGDVRTLAVLVSPPHPLNGAVLLLESTSVVMMPVGADETVSAVLAAWQGAGAQLVMDVSQPPGKVKGARLYLDPVTGAGELVIDGQSWLDRLPSLPRGWADVAVRSQTVTVYVSEQFDIDTHGSRVVSLEEILREPVRGGNVVGLKAAVVKRAARPAPTPLQEAGTRVAGLLEKMIHERARPGASTDGFNGVPDVAPLTHRPGLVHTIFNGDPILIVDLDPDDRDALRVLSADGMGLARVSDLNSYLPDASDAWQFVLWRSQIAIIRAARDRREKLLFEPFPAVGDWYDCVRDNATQPLLSSICILVGVIGITDEESLLTRLEDAMSRGNVIGGAMYGMLV